MEEFLEADYNSFISEFDKKQFGEAVYYIFKVIELTNPEIETRGDLSTQLILLLKEYDHLGIRFESALVFYQFVAQVILLLRQGKTIDVSSLLN